jgi:hypothetical protein
MSAYLILFAGILGIRPRPTISKTVVLSLHHIPAKRTKLNTIIYYLVVLEEFESSPKDFQSFMLTCYTTEPLFCYILKLGASDRN